MIPELIIFVSRGITVIVNNQHKGDDDYDYDDDHHNNNNNNQHKGDDDYDDNNNKLRVSVWVLNINILEMVSFRYRTVISEAESHLI